MRDSKRDTDVQNNLVDSVGEGKDGMIWENGIETYKISYVKQIKKFLKIKIKCLAKGKKKMSLKIR